MTAQATAQKGILNQVQESVIVAACVFFDISEIQLLSGRTYDYVYARHLCFYLINRNTFLNNRFIGNRFGCARSTVSDGVEKIECTKKIYRQTSDDLKKIAQLASISL